jgi:opacity protein-like surface antigen
MKRSLFLAVSVTALMAISDQLLAAGAETPAPSERAAPAARERAPARARPAPTPQRQAASQPSSSFTGTQAGGFGGGNAGGGGFADPAFCGGSGLINPVGRFDPACGTTTQNIGRNTGVLGGLELGQMFPMGGLWAVGWAVDAQGSTLRSEGNQQSTKVIPSGAPNFGAVINEGFSTSQTQPFGTTLRLKVGVMAMPGTMIYVTGGGAGGMVHGDFNYTAVQTNNTAGSTCVSGGIIAPGCTASATNSYDKFRWGYTVGGGVSFGFITVEYLHTDLGTVDQTIVATSPGSSSAGFATTSMKTQTDAIRVKFSMGL